MEKQALIIQTAFLGDALLCIPLIKNFKKHYPDHKLTFLCRQGLGELFEHLNLVDRVVELNKKNSSEFKKTFTKLKNTYWDFIICPHESFRSHRMVLGLKANNKIGFKNFYNFFVFNKRIKRPMHLPDALRQLSLLPENSEKAFFAKTENFKNLSQQDSLSFYHQPQIPEEFSMRVDLPGIVKGEIEVKTPAVFIAPGSVWPTKRWTLEGYSDLAGKLKNKYHVYLVGSPGEVDICNAITDQHPEVNNLCGKTSLVDLCYLLSHADMLFCNDSGTMHVAAVVGCPTVSVFGPTTLDLGYRPWNNQAVVVQKKLGCRPCGKHGHKKCPIGTHECMQSINAEDVLLHTKLTDNP